MNTLPTAVLLRQNGPSFSISLETGRLPTPQLILPIPTRTGWLRYAFTELALLRVHARHIARNPASGRVMQKLGMRHEGTLRQHARKWDKLEDLELYGILKEEWAEAANQPMLAARDARA